MTDNFRIRFLDKSEPIEKRFWDVLPHWDQLTKVQYITFRLADTLPQPKLDELRKSKEVFLLRYPRPWDEKTERLFYTTIGNKVDYWLDQNYGECLMKYQPVRAAITDAILNHHKSKYYLHEFVLMPNHVHMIVSPLGKLECAVKLIKGASAAAVNKTMNRSGNVWSKGKFDRLIRSAESFKHYVSYIRNNPRFLPADSYTVWTDPEQLWIRQLGDI